jgi:hypothetical protein
MVTPEEMSFKKNKSAAVIAAVVTYMGKLQDKLLLVGPRRQANS